MKAVGFFEMMVLTVGILRVLQAACPPGWLAWQDSCYILLHEKMNWTDASKACDRPGVSLFLPKSEDEHNFVWGKMKIIWMKEFGASDETELKLWIDCIRVDKDQFQCSGDGGVTAFINWAEGQPDHNPGNDCVRITEGSHGKWRDKKCSPSIFVVCEMLVIFNDLRPSSLRYTHVPQQCLLNHRIKSYPVKESIGCGLACWAEPLCRSFNLRKQADNKTICQLNYASRMEVDVTDIKNEENCYFYEPLDVQISATHHV